ncbi:TetR/AcrR family transcriptional regulator [Hydrogenimonas sp.]
MNSRLKKALHETKRNLVLEEVSTIFETEGFGVKMQRIAEALGMSVGALYKLFDSKEALYYAYIDYQIRLFHEKLLSLCDENDDSETVLERYVALKFEVFAAKRKAVEDPVVGDPLFFFKLNCHQEDAAGPIFDFLADTFRRLDGATPLKTRDFLETAYLFNAYTTGYVEYWLRCGGGLPEPKEALVRFLEGLR